MARFTDDLELRQPTHEEVEKIMQEARVMRAKALRKAFTDLRSMLSRLTAPKLRIGGRTSIREG
ncbi:MAG: hypothetical protein AAFV49_08115 [Pseudomonadota bacterium]